MNPNQNTQLTKPPAQKASALQLMASRLSCDADKLLIYNLVTVIVDETDAKAKAKFEEYGRYTSYDGSLVFMSGWTGIDFGQYAPTDLVKKVDTNAIISAIEHLAGGDEVQLGRRRRRSPPDGHRAGWLRDRLCGGSRPYGGRRR